MINDENRIKNEIDHGAKIKDYAENVWNWNTHAGKIRWERRVRLLSAHFESKNVCFGDRLWHRSSNKGTSKFEC